MIFEKNMKFIINDPRISHLEIWILGDLNIDAHKNKSPPFRKLIDFCREHSLKTLIHDTTCPNRNKGTSIDHILTNSLYISKSAVLNDLISDHLPVNAIRNKLTPSQITSSFLEDFIEIIIPNPFITT